MTIAFGGFREFFDTAIGHDPYPFQERQAEEGPPDLLVGSARSGKTAAAVLPWLYRRIVSAPELTPRRLVYVLPQHSLLEPTVTRIRAWTERLGCADQVGIYQLPGAEGWRRWPERSAILVGTQDVLLGRALMHGFADAQVMAPVSYGLLHNDAQWILDEPCLMGPGAATALALQGLRDRLGTLFPTHTMLMSALDLDLPGKVVADGPASALCRVRRVTVSADRCVCDVAEAVKKAHAPGSATIVALNTIERATALFRALQGHNVVLLHDRFRPSDRRRLVEAAQAEGDRIVVAAGGAEAGLELTARTVMSEVAPWAAVVQRAGRCADEGELVWFSDGSGDPLVESRLEQLEGLAFTSDGMDVRLDLDVAPREVDVRALFDNSEELDVSRWTRDDEAPVMVAWRRWESGAPEEDEPRPGQEEICHAPAAEVAALAGERGWVRDGLDGMWRRAVLDDVRPGATLVLDAEGGGYLPDEGWAPESHLPVEAASYSYERLQGCGSWVSLDQHLMETEEEARLLLESLPALDETLREAVAVGARLHDLGKCHGAFQGMLRAGGGDAPDVLLAKSKAPFNTGRSTRPHFRHELVSALILHGHRDSLTTYLVAAHHGRVRMSIRPAADEEPGFLRGVRSGDRTPPVVLSTGERFPAQDLSLDVFARGEWERLAGELRDQRELGPFRLALLETLVRVADWRSSARHDVLLTSPLATPLERP